jgi:diphthamide synthase (EF-2-diphthine--ammonia ligase)
VSLSFLWRRDQSELLEEMIAKGINAILIKTASMGLSPQKHCGRSLAQLQPMFEKLVCAIIIMLLTVIRKQQLDSMFVEKEVNMRQ